MKYSDQSYNLRIELDTENFEFNEAEIRQLERGLEPLRDPVEKFPFADLYLTFQFQPPSQHFRVKAVLNLPGKGLATGDLDEDVYAAFKRCVSKLVNKVSAFREELENTEELAKQEKGTHQEIVASQVIDAEALEEAVQRGDYGKFRQTTFPFEEAVRKRAGRWIQRYPVIEAQLGRRFDLADVVEEVFLNAYERYDEHPQEVPFGNWLEHLIDPSIKLLNDEPDEELENIDFARSAVEARQAGDVASEE